MDFGAVHMQDAGFEVDVENRGCKITPVAASFVYRKASSCSCSCPSSRLTGVVGVEFEV